MNNKSTDNISRLDDMSENNQNHAENAEIKLLDVVALTEDQPEHNLKRGEVGTVVEILSDGEAFEVEFSDDNGQMYKCSSFLASQLQVISDEPININPNRQANDALEGYYYQLCHTVDAWLDLAENDVLYVEFAEDFDIESEGTFTAIQVKHTQRNITLRSEQVTDAINNYWELRNKNKDQCVKFRLLTKSKIGKEQGDHFGIDKPGLELWNRCSNDEAVIKNISDFLQNDGKVSSEVNEFLSNAPSKEIYEQLIEPITLDTDCKSVDFVEQSIFKKLIHHGDRHGISPSKAKEVLDPLINEAWKVAREAENRELTRLLFLKIFEEKTKRLVSEQRLQHLEMLATMKENVKTGSVDSSSDSLIQPYLQIQADIPQLYLDVVLPRTELFTIIQTKLQSNGIVVIQGGVDKGKSTLANLTARAINESWFWMKLTNKDASQVALLLQHLASTIRQESTQVNVVIDDLNLQPQHFHWYEDDLGLVVHRVFERGAKLLITSQHKPPNVLIRRLGISKTIVVDVPNFTEPEIKQFASEMECPPDDTETWTALIQTHTGGHPRLVHAWLVHLREEGWNEQKILEGLLQPPDEVVEEREAARQLLTNLPENQREFLYRLSLMLIGFRKNYALNIAEILEPISHPGDVFSQLVGPWIDQVSENYYTISPLLRNAANEVWSDDRIKDLHAHISNAILKTKKLNAMDAWSVITHSIIGKNRGALISIVQALMDAEEDTWENLGQVLSSLVHIHTIPHRELFPGDVIVNFCFRSLQFRIAVESKPEMALQLLEIWDEETKPYEPRESYLHSRLMLATQALKYNHISLPVKTLVDYLNEIINITENNETVQEMHLNSMDRLKEQNIVTSNYFSYLFGFIYMRPNINVSFLNELIDTLDECDQRIRTLLLADFENEIIGAQILINGCWLAEEKLQNPDWIRCLEVFDKIIEKTYAWGYPYLAAASAIGKAIIHDEYLNNADTAHEVIQDFTLKVGVLPLIEEAQAQVYFHQEHYREALNIYERILPVWNPPSEQLDIGPLEEYRRAAICAANLDDWKKAAVFLEEGANKTQEVENTNRYIGLYADAGFAQFKSGNMLESIKLSTLALQEFEKLPQDNTDLKYYALKKRIAGSIGWIAYHKDEKFTSESLEPSVAFCSHPDINEEVLNLPDSPIELIWIALARIEYKYGDSITALEHCTQIAAKTTNPSFLGSLALLKLQYDYRNKTFENLPERIHHIANASTFLFKQKQNEIEIEKEDTNSLYVSALRDLTSVEYIIAILVSGLLSQLVANRDLHEVLAVWRSKSIDFSIRENMYTALDLIESILFGNLKQASIELNDLDAKVERRLVATFKVILNPETSPENLFAAHLNITTYFISSQLGDYIVQDLADLLSVQWLEKIKFRAALKTPMYTVPDIERACNSSETGKKKIGQILISVYPAVSLSIPSETLQQIRSWIELESEQKQEIGKNPAAQRLIKAMEKPPHLTDEDIEALNQSIKEGEIPIKFDSPFDFDDSEK